MGNRSISHTIMETARVRGVSQATRQCLQLKKALRNETSVVQLVVSARPDKHKTYSSAVMCTYVTSWDRILRRCGLEDDAYATDIFMNGVRLPSSHPAHGWKWLLVPLGFYPLMARQRLPLRVVHLFPPVSVALHIKAAGGKLHHDRDHYYGLAAMERMNDYACTLYHPVLSKIKRLDPLHVDKAICMVCLNRYADDDATLRPVVFGCLHHTCKNCLDRLVPREDESCRLCIWCPMCNQKVDRIASFA